MLFHRVSGSGTEVPKQLFISQSKFQHLISWLSHAQHTQEVYQLDVQAMKIRLVHSLSMLSV